MTCIAGYADRTGVVIGGDSAWCTDYVKMSIVGGKVFEKWGYIFGVAGSPRFLNLLKHDFVPPDPHVCPDDLLPGFLCTKFINELRKHLKIGGIAGKENDVERGNSQFLLGVRGRLFCIGSDYQVCEFTDGYAAIGSGNEVALGAFAALQSVCHDAIHVKQVVLVALEAASKHSRGVGPPFTILEQSRPPEN